VLVNCVNHGIMFRRFLLSGALRVLLWLVLLCLAPSALAREVTLQDAVISVERIWDRAGHNAFTDLIRFDDRLYCAFREGSGHIPGINGTVRIIATDDGANWRSSALLDEAAVDLRDPKLSRTPDGRIMVIMAGSFYRGSEYLRREPRVSFSDRKGAAFSAPQPIVIPESIRTDHDWLWRVTWHEGKGWGVVYQALSAGWQTHLVSTRDGIHYDHVTSFEIDGKPNETTLRFLPGGELVALIRREGGDRCGFIGTSSPPYRDWSWAKLAVRLGGPNFIHLPGGHLLMGTRGGHQNRQWNTSLFWIDTGGAEELLFALPSGGDTSYPGFVLEDGKILVSYYSSHEGKTAIYLATLRLEAL